MPKLVNLMSSIIPGVFSVKSLRYHTMALVVALIAAGCGPIKNSPEPPIRFTAEVPVAPPQMDVYRLAVTPAPLDFLNEKLSAARLPALELKQKTYISRDENVKDEFDQVRAFADTTTGDANFIPNLVIRATRRSMTVDFAYYRPQSFIQKFHSVVAALCAPTL